MPLFRIETRKKKGTRPPERRAKAQGGGSTRSLSTARALAAGALVGLIIIAGVSASLVLRGRNRGEAGVPASPMGGAQPAVGPTLAPLSADYPPEAIIAYVNGEPYTMAELETAVRIARVLGSYTSDEVPPDGSPDLPGYLVVMLRRQIDVMLMKQAAAREQLQEPSGSLDIVIDAFLGEVGSTRQDLAARMTANGVTDADLGTWFSDSRTVNFFVQTKLVVDGENTDRDEVVQDWLAEQWSTQDIIVNFYDPDQVLPTDEA